MHHFTQEKILVTGATGYVGGRLIPLLLDRGYQVRCLVRDLARIEGRGWEDAVDAVQGDVLQYETLLPAMKDIRVAYYLVHSMAEGAGFQERDLKAAFHFGKAAYEAGVGRIIYLGGLGVDNERLSTHLKSRHQTGAYLRKSGVPVTEFRAAQIIGSGSASFELIRNSVERVPILVTSSLISTRSQPIAIGDVLRYLTDCLEIPETTGKILEIGGKDILTYREMLLTYAKIRGLKRWIIGVPFISAGLSAYIIDLVTPIPAHIARPLVEGLKNEVLVRDDTARKLFHFLPIGYGEAVRIALKRIESGKVSTTWWDAFSSFAEMMPDPVKLANTEGMIMEKRQTIAHADQAITFKVISCFGGEEGWLYAEKLWHIRGFLDRLFGGVGLRRGRRCPIELRTGDTLGFWRVEALEKNRLLRLRAEMKMRSRAWLQFEIEEIEKNRIIITQTAFFEPKGLLGLMYWYALYPIHKIIFSGMIQTLAQRAERTTREYENSG